jgi:gephyrin
MAGPLKVGILIVSTTASKDPSTDAAEPVLRDVFEKEGEGKWEIADTKIVPDVVTQIQRQIMLWADIAEGISLIITTGGTGFAIADNTPEVTCQIMQPFSTRVDLYLTFSGRRRPSPQASPWSGARNAGDLLGSHAV